MSSVRLNTLNMSYRPNRIPDIKSNLSLHAPALEELAHFTTRALLVFADGSRVMKLKYLKWFINLNEFVW